MHNAYTETDTVGAFIQIVFVDYRKAFNHLDQNMIIDKLRWMKVPDLVVGWISFFLQDRWQRVKLVQFMFDWANINTGFPQGTKLETLLFLCIINGLQSSSPTKAAKFVDDTTLQES